jgi:hypothetical protein
MSTLREAVRGLIEQVQQLPEVTGEPLCEDVQQLLEDLVGLLAAHPARPEHEVKAEALREAAEDFRGIDMPVAADHLENLADGWARPLRGETS